MENTEIRYVVLREHYFSIGNVKDVDYKILGRTVAEHIASKYRAEIVDTFPKFSGKCTVVFRTLQLCLPQKGLDALVYKALNEKENLFFGGGWILVNSDDPHKAKFAPLKGGVEFLSPADLPFVEEELKAEIIKKLLRRGVILEGTDVFVDATARIESGAYLSHGVIVKGNSVIRSGAKILPYTLVEDSEVQEGAVVGPFAHLRHDRFSENQRPRKN